MDDWGAWIAEIERAPGHQRGLWMSGASSEVGLLDFRHLSFHNIKPLIFTFEQQHLILIAVVGIEPDNITSLIKYRCFCRLPPPAPVSAERSWTIETFGDKRRTGGTSGFV
jgi:hypothetical protein